MIPVFITITGRKEKLVIEKNRIVPIFLIIRFYMYFIYVWHTYIYIYIKLENCLKCMLGILFWQKEKIIRVVFVKFDFTNVSGKQISKFNLKCLYVIDLLCFYMVKKLFSFSVKRANFDRKMMKCCAEKLLQIFYLKNDQLLNDFIRTMWFFLFDDIMHYTIQIS